MFQTPHMHWITKILLPELYSWMFPGYHKQGPITQCLINTMNWTHTHTHTQTHDSFFPYAHYIQTSPSEFQFILMFSYIWSLVIVIVVNLVTCNKNLEIILDSLFGFIQKTQKVQILWFLPLNKFFSPSLFPSSTLT